MITAHRYNDASCQCLNCAAPVIAIINNRFSALGLMALEQAQIDCLCDSERADEALGMLDHWESSGWIVGSERGEVAAFICRSEMDSEV